MNLPIPSSIPAVISHLLAQQPRAREKLAAHAGKVACVDAGVIAIRLKATADGLVETAKIEEPAAVTIRVKLADIPLMLQNRERAFSYVKIEGDADFASAISRLSETLRWEAEEDLSKWIGDVAAVRVVATARTAIDTVRTTQKKIAENIAEYFLEERPILVRPQSVNDFASDVARLRDDVERLAKRIEKMEGRC